MILERIPAIAAGSLALALLGAVVVRDAGHAGAGTRDAARTGTAGGLTVTTQDAHAAGALPVYGAVPDFSLEDSAGKALRRSDLAGHVWIADFIFTRCTGPCARMTQRMSALAARLAGAPQVRLVTFTVDPEHDTRDVLGEYARRAGAPADRWQFATGAAKAIYSLSRDGFKLGAGPNDPAAVDLRQMPFMHSTRLVLVDGGGSIRGYYDADDDAAIEALVRDATRLSREHA